MMRWETLIKRLEKILSEKDGKEARRKLEELIVELKVRSEREKTDKSRVIQHLMGWYLGFWDGKPPEMLRFMEPNKVIGKALRELVVIYERNGEDVDTLKKDYEEFKRTWRTGDKGILHFRSALRYIKQRQGSEWVDEEYKTGKNFWEEDDQLPWEEKT